MSALTRRPPTWGLVQHRSRFFGSSRGGGCLLEQGPDALLIGRSQSHRSQGFGECAAPSGVEGAPAVVGDSCWLRCKPQQHVRRLCPISEPCRYHHRWRCALMVVLIVCVCVEEHEFRLQELLSATLRATWRLVRRSPSSSTNRGNAKVHRHRVPALSSNRTSRSTTW